MASHLCYKEMLFEGLAVLVKLLRRLIEATDHTFTS